MTLTKTDLSAIKEIVYSSIESQTPSVVRKVIKEELVPIRKDIEVLKKGQKKMQNSLDEHFKFLDKDVSYFKRKTADHLGIAVSELSAPIDKV